MFKPSGLGNTIMKQRYSHYENEEWYDIAERVGKFVGQRRHKKIQHKYMQLIADARLAPGGRILFGAGQKKPAMINCFIAPPIDDSREGWVDACRLYLLTTAIGGGIGLAGNKIRPNKSEIKGYKGTASGPLSIFRILNFIGTEIVGGNNRKAATMLSLTVDHPDILDFIDAKKNRDELNMANVSVEINEKFIEAVEKDLEWLLKFKGKEHKKISAKKLFNVLVEGAYDNGEPGLLNFGLSNHYNNLWYISPIVGTNPCGEITGREFSCCCLASINLPEHIKNNKLHLEKFYDTVFYATMFLNDVLDLNEYPCQEFKNEAMKERRIGLGITGLHDYLILTNKKYSEAQKEVEFLYETLRNATYEASCSLAKAEGPFDYFDAEKYLEGNFIKSLPDEIKKAIKYNGIRNAYCNTQAPCGTQSLVLGVTSGIEPMFSPAYKRTWRTDNGLESSWELHPLLEKFMKEGKNYNNFEGAYDITVGQHLEIQKAAQKYIDQSISKTINLPADYQVNDLSAIMLKYACDLKGFTIYRQGSRGQEPLTPCSIETVLEKRKMNATETIISNSIIFNPSLVGNDLSCPNGACNL